MSASYSKYLKNMEMLKGYDTDELSSEESDKEMSEREEKEINLRCVRQVYLITYIQADEVRFPSRKSYADAVLFSFNDTPGKVVQWCCCLEKHSSNVIHYHMAVKLDRNQRWLQSKKFLLEKRGISVCFSAIHSNYYSAWQYVTKQDSRFIQSVGHPHLANYHQPSTTLG